MSIPYYRDVDYIDDGCDETQCLSCGSSWAWRGSSYIDVHYCMFCGVKFAGKLQCRPHSTPRWLWNYCQDHVGYSELESSYWNSLGRRKSKIWVIEERTLFPNSDGSVERIAQDWHRHIPLTWAKTAMEALRALNSEREIQATYPVTFSREEYRLRRYNR